MVATAAPMESQANFVSEVRDSIKSTFFLFEFCMKL
jgi:hypothetical protein